MTSINNSFYVSEIDNSDVISVIMSGKNSSTTYDNISDSIAKELINRDITPLTQVQTTAKYIFS